MSQYSEIPGDVTGALLNEQLRASADRIFNQLYAADPTLSLELTSRAERLAVAFVMGVGESDEHPAIPTLSTAMKKILFLFQPTSAEDLGLTDQDVNLMFSSCFAGSDGDLQEAVNLADQTANYYMTMSIPLAEEWLGPVWPQMSASQRLWYVQGLADALWQTVAPEQ